MILNFLSFETQSFEFKDKKICSMTDAIKRTQVGIREILQLIIKCLVLQNKIYIGVNHIWDLLALEGY